MRNDMQDRSLPLQLAAYLEQPRLNQGPALRVTDIAPDDEIHLTGLILDRQEGDAVSIGRVLPQQHQADGAHQCAMWQLVELCGRGQSLRAQLLTQQRKRMTPQC